MKVLIAAAEAVPFAKTGGLADVTGSLPAALRAQGVDARLVLPAYRGAGARGNGPARRVGQVSVRVGASDVVGHVLETTSPGNGTPVYLIRNDAYYDRDGLYGHPDDLERFTFFCRAVLALGRAVGWSADVIHCHDWHTGLIPVLALLEGRARPATAFTIHNLAYQGTFPKDAARVIGVARGSEGFRLLEMGGFLNFLKGGIVSADCVNTVSPKYAREIQTPDFGEGLDGVLRLRDEAVTGILNGIDYTEWDPATDAALAANYSRDDISGKLTCKRALQRANALPEEDVPVLGVVSRLATQKGLGLIELVLDELLAADLQFVLLGTGEPHYHELFEEVAKRLPDKTGINLKYDNTLAHRIYAGSDLFLIPSQYEPCGLTQMIALAYGTIPIVRATGGLADTVHEHGPSANGFVFFDSSPDSLIAAIDRALAAYKDDLRWRGLMENAFASNFPWERSAGEYVKLYERALDLAPAAPAMADTT